MFGLLKNVAFCLQFELQNFGCSTHSYKLFVYAVIYFYKCIISRLVCAIYMCLSTCNSVDSIRTLTSYHTNVIPHVTSVTLYSHQPLFSIKRQGLYMCVVKATDLNFSLPVHTSASSLQPSSSHTIFGLPLLSRHPASQVYSTSSPNFVPELVMIAPSSGGISPQSVFSTIKKICILQLQTFYFCMFGYRTRCIQIFIFFFV